MSEALSGSRIQKKPKATTHLMSGGLAGLVSAITLQPFDLLKTRLQQQQRSNANYRTSIRKEILKLKNIKDLWRGVLPSCLRTSIGAGLYFTILSSSRNIIARLKQEGVESTSSVLPRLSHIENLASGAAVRAVVGLITMPITVIKTRYESNAYSYNSMYEGIESIYMDGMDASKGSVRNFFKGSMATLARDCPYAGLYVLFYEWLKNDVMNVIILPLRVDSTYKLLSDSQLIHSSSAILAASLATTITAPFDAIKTRLQLASTTLSKSPTTFISVTRELLLERGGFRNLFRGLSLRLGRKGLSAGISWCIYEELIKLNIESSSLHSKSKKLD